MSTQEIIELLIRSNSLKRIQRSGWITAGIHDTSYESIAAHSWGTCIISLIISKQLRNEECEVDLGSVFELAVMHDLPEIVITDIPHSAFDIVGQELQEAKKGAEKEAIKSLLSPLREFGAEMLKTWETSADLHSIEARIVAGADIIDMLVHAISLERSGVSPLILDSFFSKSRKKINSLNIEMLNGMYNILLNQHLDDLQKWEMTHNNKD